MIDHGRAAHVALQQVVELLVVNFEEGALDYDLCFVSASFFLVEDHANDARDDAQVFLLDSDGVPTTHRECLSRAGLAVRQNRRIEADEATEDQVSHARIEDGLLRRVDAKRFVESECSVLAHYDLVIWLVGLHTYFGAFSELLADEGPDSDGYAY